MRETPDQLTADYVNAIVAQTKAIAAGRQDQIARLNRAILSIRRELRTRGVEGRAALIGLLEHPASEVRVWAASDVLEFAPDKAEPILEVLAESGKPSAAFDARATLEEWRAGRLKWDY
jgi:hypothetical protein